MPSRGLTPAQEKEIIKNYRNPKFSVVRVAKEAGVSKVTLYQVLHRTGTPLRGHPQGKRRVSGVRRAIIEKRKAEMHELLAIGFSRKDIAAELKISIGTVHRDLRTPKEEK